jgi:hypothetical protein
MLKGAVVKDQLRSGVWEECVMTVIFLSNITSIKNKEICPYEVLFGCKSKLSASLRSFGEIGVVTTKTNIRNKMKIDEQLASLLDTLYIIKMMFT